MNMYLLKISAKSEVPLLCIPVIIIGLDFNNLINSYYLISQSSILKFKLSFNNLH